MLDAAVVLRVASLTRMRCVVLTACLLLAALWARSPAGAAQGANQWSPRQRIPGIHDDARAPYLVADRNRTVHAFHSQPARTNASQLAIVYSRWSRRDGWTMPTDIVLPPLRAQASILGAFLDGQGVMHIVFFSGDDAVANLYYSSAWASNAAMPRAWSPPALIGEAAITPRTAALAGDAQGNLTVVYSGNRQGIGLYTVHSSDSGATWSEPAPFFRVDREDLQPWAGSDPRPWDLQVAQDHAGRLHLAWVVVGRDGNGKAIYYAGRDANSKEWEAPLLLATVKPDQYEVDWPSIAAHRGELLLIYDDYHPPKRMMRASRDAGRTWLDPVDVLAPTRGEYGNAAFAVDGGDRLHVVFGDRARGLNLWHSVWERGGWREPEPIAPQAEASTYPSGPEKFHPSQPRIVMRQGNVLLAVWPTDPGSIHNGTWYAYKLLDVPELPIEALPVPSPLPAKLLLVGALALALLVGTKVTLLRGCRRAARAGGRMK